MNKKFWIIVSVILTVSCLAAVFVSATDVINTPEKTQVVSEKVYYAYYNSKSSNGAVAFCLNNQFVSFGTSQEDIRLCTKQADGTIVSNYTISKENTAIWFYGKTEHSISTGETTQSLLGGLSGIGITLDSSKTNVAFKLTGQPIEENTAYYIYIPEDYFLDAQGIGNQGAYIEITADKVNAYSGNLLEDLQKATDAFYDAALFGIESFCGIFG